jgi:hypothetical protein
MKKNMPPETPITITIELQQWFAIIAALSNEGVYNIGQQKLSELGRQQLQLAGESIVDQLTAWQKS